MCVFLGINVWDDIEPDSRPFIKEYLKQYPEVQIQFYFCLVIKFNFCIHFFSILSNMIIIFQYQ